MTVQVANNLSDARQQTQGDKRETERERGREKAETGREGGRRRESLQCALPSH